jgi:hypothetical protein
MANKKNKPSYVDPMADVTGMSFSAAYWMSCPCCDRTMGRPVVYKWRSFYYCSKKCIVKTKKQEGLI